VGEQQVFLYFPIYYQSKNIKNGHLIQNTKIKIGKYNYTFKKDSLLSFYENGNVSTGSLFETTTIDAQNNKIKLETLVWFLEDGSLFNSHLAENTVIRVKNNTIELAKNTLIGFSKDLKIIFGITKKNCKIKVGSFLIHFYGQENATLSITFYESGCILKLKLDGQGNFVEENNKINMEGKREFSFTESGELKDTN
jgi:hypothetical protein